MSKQVKILVLPGLGDIYWVMVKLKSFLSNRNIDKPLVYTWELQPHKLNRSAEYIRRIPFVEYGGPWFHPHNIDEFNQIYFKDIWLISNFKEFDYVISMNGILRNGYTVEDWGLEYHNTDWYYQLIPSVEEETTYNKFKNEKYVLAYFTEGEMYEYWMKYLSLQDIYTILYEIHKRTGYRIILTGGGWDIVTASKLVEMDKNNFIENMVGKTSLNELFGLIRGAKGMIGWCGGNTIKSVYFKTPTLMLWSMYFKNKNFFVNSVPPDSVGEWYKPLIVDYTSKDDVINTFVQMVNK